MRKSSIYALVEQNGNKNKNGLAIVLIVVVAIAGWQTWVYFNRETVDIRYGGQYYPGEFLLLGMPELWEKYGIRVQHILFSSGAEGNEALISGKVDINCGADSKTIALFNAIPDQALIIGTLQRGDRYATVVRADSNITSWYDLLKIIGKKVATRIGTGAEGVIR